MRCMSLRAMKGAEEGQRGRDGETKQREGGDE